MDISVETRELTHDAKRSSVDFTDIDIQKRLDRLLDELKPGQMGTEVRTMLATIATYRPNALVAISAERIVKSQDNDLLSLANLLSSRSATDNEIALAYKEVLARVFAGDSRLWREAHLALYLIVACDRRCAYEEVRGWLDCNVHP
jgi:hypothetical protein